MPGKRFINKWLNKELFMNVKLVGDKMEMNAQYVSFSNKLAYFLTVFMIIVNS